jgi:effector-binding domain-containing protein
MDSHCEAMYRQLYVGLRRLGLKPSMPEITLYHATEYAETDLDVEAAVAVPAAALERERHDAEITIRGLPSAAQAACLAYEGSFSGLPAAILELLQWIAVQRLALAGPLREVHLSGPAHPDGTVVDTTVLELQIPVLRR